MCVWQNWKAKAVPRVAPVRYVEIAPAGETDRLADEFVKKKVELRPTPCRRSPFMDRRGECTEEAAGERLRVRRDELRDEGPCNRAAQPQLPEDIAEAAGAQGFVEEYGFARSGSDRRKDWIVRNAVGQNEKRQASIHMGSDVANDLGTGDRRRSRSD